jgi:hypothetical protein
MHFIIIIIISSSSSSIGKTSFLLLNFRYKILPYMSIELAYRISTYLSFQIYWGSELCPSSGIKKK